MILLSIQVEGWRCFALPVALESFDAGLNVLHAPNGTGKSTLFEALARAFFDRHNSSGEAAEALRPWGRDLTPTVTVRFLREGHEYRVTKQFLDAPRCVLERLEEGSYIPLANGPKAAEQLRGLLLGSVPGHGLCDARHWGVAQILWAPQGDLALGELSEPLIGQVQMSLNAQLAAAGSGEVERRIEQLYGQYYTPKGRMKSGAQAPPAVALEAQLAAACARRDHVAATLEELSIASEDVARLRAEGDRLAAVIAETSQEYESVRHKAEALALLRSKVETASSRVKQLEAQYERLQQTANAIAGARREIHDASREAELLSARIPVLEEEEAGAAVQRAAAQAEVERAEQAGDATGLEAVADAARAFAETSRLLAELTKLEVHASEADEERRTFRRKREELGKVPDRPTLAGIRDTLHRRDQAAARLESASLTLTLKPAPDADPGMISAIRVLTGDRPAPGSVLEASPGGDPVTVQGAPEVELELPGVGRLRARGPAGTVEQIRKALEDSTRELERLTAPFGTSDLHRLEELVETAHDLETRQRAGETALKTVLAGFAEAPDGSRRTVLAALEALRVELAGQAARLETILVRHPEWRENPPDPEALQRRLDEMTASRQRELAAARAQLSKADAVHRAAQVALQRERSALDHAQVRCKNAERRLASHLEEDSPGGAQADLLSPAPDRDAERRAHLTRLAMDREVASERLKEAEGELARMSSGPDGELPDPALLETRLADLRNRRDRALQDAAHRQGELARLASEAPYSRLAEAEEEIAQLTEELAEERQKMEAVRLLHEVADSCRRSAFENVLEPVQRTASDLFHRLAGKRLGPVHLGGAFAVQGVRPTGVDSVVDLRQLSGGEREQLHFAVRLALARELARSERHLFVLDDTFAATDLERLGRIRSVLAEAAENDNLQVLVLTCHPEFYDEWRVAESARFHDLSGLLARQRQEASGTHVPSVEAMAK